MEKRCSKCHIVKLLTEFHKKGGKRGEQLRSVCKTCDLIHQREKYKNKRDTPRCQDTNTKTCMGCKRTLSADCFGSHKKRAKGLAQKCKECRLIERNKSRKMDNQKTRELRQNRVKNGRCRTGCGRDIVPNTGYCQTCTESIYWKMAQRSYGLNRKTWEEIYWFQGNVCAICKEPGILPAQGGSMNETLCVDHDHKTGLIRGIIHGRCNHALGHIRDDANIARGAANYLENNFGHQKQLKISDKLYEKTKMREEKNNIKDLKQ